MASFKGTVCWKRSRLGAVVAEDRGGTDGGGAVVRDSSGSVGGSMWVAWECPWGQGIPGE